VRRTLSAVALVVALGSAGGSSGAEESPDGKALRERVTQYWDYRVARDPKVYTFYAPPEKGGPTDFSEISDYGPVQYTAYEIQSIDIQGDRAFVRIRGHHVIVGEKVVQVPDRFRWVNLTREWIKVDGVWYQKPTKPGLGVVEKFDALARERRKAAQQAPAAPAAEGGAKQP
jgi:hypothetical protein